MTLADELRAGLEILASSRRVTPTAPVSWEIRGEAEKPLLHLWAENCNLTRRVVAISLRSENSMLLAVERFGRAQPQKMELIRTLFERNIKTVSRCIGRSRSAGCSR